MGLPIHGQLSQRPGYSTKRDRIGTAAHKAFIFSWFTAFYPSLSRIMLVKQCGVFDNANPRGYMTQVDGSSEKKRPSPEIVTRIKRLDGAHLNGNEVLPLWIGAIIVGNYAGLDHHTLNVCSIAFIGLRLLYNYIYVEHNQVANGFLRSGIFFGALSVPLYLYITAANKLMLA